MLLLLTLACAARQAPVTSPADIAALPTPDNCDPATWPERIRAPLQEARDRGFRLARRDHFAWQATDRVTEATGGIDRVAKAWGLVGYVIEDTSETDAVVSFIGFVEGEPRVQARVAFDAAHPNGVYEAVPAAPASLASVLPLVAGAAAQQDARLVRTWPGTYNLDVLPWSADPAEGHAVYVIPGATDWNAVPFGGGYRVHVSQDGQTVLGFEALEPAVQTLPLVEIERAGVRPAYVLAAPVPDATHVSFARIWKTPLLAIAGGRDLYYLAPDRVCWASTGSPG